MAASYTARFAALGVALALAVVVRNASAADPTGTVVLTDSELFNAICSNETLIWLGADLNLREEHWPSWCSAPVLLAGNLTISGPLNESIKYTIHFNFMARKVTIPPFHELRLRHFTARNTRKGGGGDIDFVAYSPKGILWTDDLNKNQIICTTATNSTVNDLLGLPLPDPNDFPEFKGKQQMVEILPRYCLQSGQCWADALHYEQYYTNVNVGSDTDTGGYVMAKRNATKSCDNFVTADCISKLGATACMAAVIDAFLLSIQPSPPPLLPPLLPPPLLPPPPPLLPPSPSPPPLLPPQPLPPAAKEVRTLAIALPVALGGTAVIVLVVGTAVFLLARRRRARRQQQSAAAAVKRSAKGAGDGSGDAECGEGVAAAATGDCKAGATAASGGRTLGGSVVCSGGVGGSSNKRGVYGSGGSSSGSKEVTSSSSNLVSSDAVMASSSGNRNGFGHGTADSFRYETVCDMGRALGPAGGCSPMYGSGAAGGGGGFPSGGGGSAQVEGVMSDGSVCTIAVGTPLGQGSYGIVFKGTWQDRPVAVKIIMCDKAYGEQVANEVRLMTSEACRHPNLLRAHACMSRVRLVNRHSQASQQLESALASLASSNRKRSGASPAAAVAAGSGKSTGSSLGSEMAETWIVSEYCDLGALAPHVHVAKRFLDMEPAASSCPTAATATAAATASDSSRTAGTGGAASAASTLSLGASANAAAAGAGVAPCRPRPRLALILGCLRDIAGGMSHLHSLNVVHGDLKLANVLLCSSSSSSSLSSSAAPAGDEDEQPPPPQQQPQEGNGGEEPPSHTLPAFASHAPDAWLAGPLPAGLVAKVADFGLSRWLKEGQTHHSTKTVGTVTHMPPELLRSGKLTLSGDVFSFGIIMWELLTGSVPYKGLMYGEVVERVVVSHRRPEFPSHTPAAYRSLAERCWAADAAVRPTFAAVHAELEGLLAAAAELQQESDGAGAADEASAAAGEGAEGLAQAGATSEAVLLMEPEQEQEEMLGG